MVVSRCCGCGTTLSLRRRCSARGAFLHAMIRGVARPLAGSLRCHTRGSYVLQPSHHSFAAMLTGRCAWNFQSHCKLSFKALSVDVSFATGRWCARSSDGATARCCCVQVSTRESGASLRRLQKMGPLEPALFGRSKFQGRFIRSVARHPAPESHSSCVCQVPISLSTGRAQRMCTFSGTGFVGRGFLHGASA